MCEKGYIMIEIPLGMPYIGYDEKIAVCKIIDSGLIATGECVHDFENELANKFEKKYCVVVNSGTSALWLALRSTDIKNIIIPTLTCNAVLDAVLHAGLNPILSDVDHDTHNLDLSTLSEKELRIADGVIVTHAYGHSVDFSELNEYIDNYDLRLIEDFAQATGGYYKNKILGSFGHISVTSFYGPKNLTTGFGGAIFTDDREVYELCLHMRGKYTSTCSKNVFPLNLRMTDIQAAIGLIQLKKLDEMVDMRRWVAGMYQEKLKNIVELMPEKAYARHAYYKFAIKLQSNVNKMDFIKKMAQNGIQTGVLYDPPLHKIRNFDFSEKFPVAEQVSLRMVSLPMYPGMDMKSIIKVCESIENILVDGYV